MIDLERRGARLRLNAGGASRRGKLTLLIGNRSRSNREGADR